MGNGAIKWLEEWYLSNCNNDWEHSYGITIETTDNPGWHVKINLKDTPFENGKRDYVLTKINENDWLGFKIENAEFVAVGDPSKLSKLLELFREFVEERNL